MIHKQSSSRMSTIAAEVLAATKDGETWPDMVWLIDRARALAASVLGQDETKGQGPSEEK